MQAAYADTDGLFCLEGRGKTTDPTEGYQLSIVFCLKGKYIDIQKIMIDCANPCGSVLPNGRVEVPDASSGKRPTAAPEAQHQPHVLVQPLKVDHFVENGHVVYGVLNQK